MIPECNDNYLWLKGAGSVYFCAIENFSFELLRTVNALSNRSWFKLKFILEEEVFILLVSILDRGACVVGKTIENLVSSSFLSEYVNSGFFVASLIGKSKVKNVPFLFLWLYAFSYDAILWCLESKTSYLAVRNMSILEPKVFSCASFLEILFSVCLQDVNLGSASGAFCLNFSFCY